MRWAIDYPLESKASIAFVQALAKVPDPVLHVSSTFETSEERIAWTILGTALFQDLNYSEFNSLFSTLAKKFPGDSLWKLPVPREDELRAVLVEVLGKKVWSLAENFPGIFWSVGNFVRRHAPLEEWISSRDVTEIWRDLGEIYFMGKGASRPKVCAAIYRIVSQPPFGLGIAAKSYSKNLSLPVTMGLRRFLAFIGPGKGKDFANMTQVQKQRMAQSFYRFACPENPVIAMHAYQFFLENGKKEFICRSVTDKCKKCPLREFCNEAC